MRNGKVQKMTPKNENICKFVSSSVGEKLTTINFVFEKNASVMEKTLIRPDCIMALVASGRGRLRIGDSSWELDTGTLFFTFPSEAMTFDAVEDLQYLYISFHSEGAKPLFDRFEVSERNRVFRGYEGLLSFWQNAIGKASEKNLDLLSESVLLYTFSQMTPPSANAEQYRINSIIHLIETRFTERKLTLEACADAIGYNPKYISHIFRKNVGVTFSEYLKNTRIKHAIFLIEQGISSVKNIALLSGYADPLYFSHVFRKSVGVSPSEYIARINGRDKLGEKDEESRKEKEDEQET